MPDGEDLSEGTLAEAVDEALKQQTKDGWMRDAVLAVVGVLLRSGELVPREQLEEAVRAVLSHSDRAERAEAALEETRASQARMCDVADDLLARAESAEAALAELLGSYRSLAASARGLGFEGDAESWDGPVLARKALSDIPGGGS